MHRILILDTLKGLIWVENAMKPCVRRVSLVACAMCPWVISPCNLKRSMEYHTVVPCPWSMSWLHSGKNTSMTYTFVWFCMVPYTFTSWLWTLVLSHHLWLVTHGRRFLPTLKSRCEVWHKKPRASRQLTGSFAASSIDVKLMYRNVLWDSMRWWNCS